MNKKRRNKQERTTYPKERLIKVPYKGNIMYILGILTAFAFVFSTHGAFFAVLSGLLLVASIIFDYITIEKATPKY